MVRKDSAVFSGESLVGSWRKHISEEQTRRAVEILSLFGLDGIYAEDPMPLVNGERFQAQTEFLPASHAQQKTR